VSGPAEAGGLPSASSVSAGPTAPAPAGLPGPAPAGTSSTSPGQAAGAVAMGTGGTGVGNTEAPSGSSAVHASPAVLSTGAAATGGVGASGARSAGGVSVLAAGPGGAALVLLGPAVSGAGLPILIGVPFAADVPRAPTVLLGVPPASVSPLSSGSD